MELDFTKVGYIDKNSVDALQAKMIPDFDDTPEQRIYHYTSIGGLQGILGGKLHFTHIGYMNDRDEVVAGSEALRDFALQNCDDAFAQAISHEAERNKDMSAYVCCFSLERDSLAMWNYYTKDVNNQGYNLAFNYKELIISLLQKNNELDGCQLSFGKVDYCNGTENYISLSYKQAARNISSAMHKLIELACEYAQKKKDPDSSPVVIDCPPMVEEYPSVIKYMGDKASFRKTISSDTIFFMKRPCFSVESEFRIVIQIPDAVMDRLKHSEAGRKKYKYRVSNGLLIPYLELDFDLHALTGLTASPTIKSDLAEKSIRDYCDYCGINPDSLTDGIIQSSIPVRF